MKRCLADDGYWKRKPCNKECVDYDTCIYRINKDKAEEKLKELQETEEYYKTSNRHDKGELRVMQGYSLERKIQLTCERINAWYEWWDGNVYVSFSGGKDSTVLLDLVRNRCGLKDVPAMFLDTGLEYPEIRDFVKTFDNVDWIKPKMNFKKVIFEYGYPFISKEVSAKVERGKKYLENLKNGNGTANYASFADFLNIDKCRDSEGIKLLKEGKLIQGNETFEELFAIAEKSDVQSQFNKKQWLFLLFGEQKFSAECCHIMKKEPAIEYENTTGRKPIIGTMATESLLRENTWVKNGCNAFYSPRPKSTPMSFWTEQDVYEYIKKYNIPICSLYGDVVEDVSGTDEIEGQLTFSDLEGFENYTDYDAEKPMLKTTGCNRTGCMFCGYGCHREEKGEGRFLQMKESHPKQYEYIMKPVSEGGLGYKELIDWLNEKGDLHIEY